jgi:hypothetical protein
MSTEQKSEKENSTIPYVNPDLEKLNPQYEFAKQIVSNIIYEPKKRKSPAIVIAGILLITISSFFLMISIGIIIFLHGSAVFWGFWNLGVSIFTIIVGIYVIRHKIWARKWALGTSFGNIAVIIMQWSNNGIVPLLIFIAFFVAIFILIILNFSRFHEEDLFDNLTIPDKNTVTIDMEIEELKSLQEAKERDEITETEFEQKAIEIKVKFRTLPFTDSLLKRKNNGMLTEEEYQKKLNQLMLEKQEEVANEMRIEREKQEIYTQRLSQIPPEKIEKLTVPNKSRLNKFIDLMEPNDIIVFHDHQIKLIRAERWAAINEANTQDQFEIIFRN